MDLATVSVRRPVFTLVVSILIVVFGVIGFTRLGVREFPAIDPPTLSITTSYPGAAAEVIEAQITQPIEEAVNAVAGIRTIRSTSREGTSVINVEFTLETDLDTAASDVRDQLGRVVRNLPTDANPPILNKSNADSSPIFGIAVRSTSRSQLELAAFANNLKERIQTIPGIAGIDQPAEKRYAMRLWMDPEKLSAYGITPLDVRAALARENIELPSGRIEGATVDLPVKTLSRLNTPAEFDDLVIKRNGDTLVRFRDVGYAELGALNERGALKIGSEPIAGLYVKQQPGANQVEIADAVRQRLDELRREIPDDIQVEVAYDNSQYVRRSLFEVQETVVIAFVLVLLVVFFFLREWRSTLIPMLAIPVSIVGTFAVLDIAGFSINTLTLLGIVLAIGLVVDDAIVVLENIYAKVENGVPVVQASIEGTREIFLAIVATTIVLAVVFLPLLFLGGISGQLFREFGVTVASAVLISAFLALTLTPMLCSRLLRPAAGAHGHGWLHRKTEPFFQAMERGYGRALGLVIGRGWIAVAILVVSGGVAWTTFKQLPRELAPLEDRGRLWVRATGAEGVGYDYMQAFMDDVAQTVAEQTPEAHFFMTQVPGSGGGVGAVGAANSGFVRVFLKDREDREASQQEIARRLQGALRGMTGARLNVTQEASIGERRSQSGGVDFVIQAASIDQLAEVVPEFLEEARKDPAFAFVDSDLKFNKPELQVGIARSKAQTMGVSALDIAQTLQSSLSGQRFGYFIFDGRQYEVVGQLTRDYRSSPEQLGNIGVRSATGDVVRLDNLIEFSERSTPPELFRYNRYVAATVSATLNHGYTLGQGIAALQTVADRTLDERFTTELTGAAKDFRDSSSSLGWVFGLAVLLIYLVLAAQFESFRSPFVIMLTVPLSLSGAVLALWLFDQTLNIFSQIGLIMLVGLVTKNGILIVEFANQRLAAGAPSALEAVREAAEARLRPILMTTLATILGVLPIALALGAGAESRVSMGIGVIGGLIVGSALTLIVIPATYAMVFARRTSVAAHAEAITPHEPIVASR
ncbi:efflux RND transporter permease subunit [Opitutales bacterium ASA1]|uniref:efflux RND transporter permease subunit n=1 Tax=Congregicoccus parvus TaxID=3081749 RepID=UPI002B323598|nr:efflux RND transporter permease subunit [Opitutales bacterium ASA1]